MDILVASVMGETCEVVRLVEKGEDINAKNAYQQTPLILAAKYGYLEIAEYLLKQNPDINSQDDNRNTALIWACATGHLEIAKLLIRNGADVNLKNYQATALWYAFQKDFLSVSKYLVQRGAKVDGIAKGLLLSGMNNRKDSMYLLALCYEIFPKKEFKKKKFKVNFKNAC